ncbi:MAG TPA: beta-eliminating lyase-related protein, partial [Puia sp.]|nr:beta-eliminating lyase-related protein [Puia sp.]
ENTANRGGGSCYELEEIRSIRELCTERQLKLHLDGARLFNALVAKNQTARQYGSLFDSISVCLNKGLGCPIGSILMGTAAFIRQARRVRKVFGGGMRQAGFMAAAGIYALEHHVDRLAIDHTHAKQIAAALEKKSFVRNILPVETNIIIFELEAAVPAATFTQRLRQSDILAIPIAAQQVRFVTHLDISPAMVEQTVVAIEQL